MVQQSQQQSSLGYIIALGAGSLTTLAFLVFPYVSFGIFGSYTAIQLTNRAWIYTSSSLWLELIVALLIVGLSCFSLYKKDSSPIFAIVITQLSGMTLLVLSLTYIQQSMQPNFFGVSIVSYYTTGFWLYLIGIMAALVGGIVQLSIGVRLHLPRQQPAPFQQSQQPNGPPSPLP